MNRESPHPDASRERPAGSAPVSRRSFIHRVLDVIPPTSGAIVMASGIVSIDLDSGDHRILSAITLWFAARRVEWTGQLRHPNVLSASDRRWRRKRGGINE
jgi:hypothetical protein